MSKESVYDEEPPPYSAAANMEPASIPSLFTTHLTDLPSRILSAQAARSSIREQRDSEILSLIVPHVEGFLSSIASMDPPPTLAEMILVPESVVGEDWQFSEETERRIREVQTVVRVSSRKASSQGQSWSDKALDGQGTWDEPRCLGQGLWWSDEAMAQRLAIHLQPAPRVDRPAIKAHVSQAKEAKKSGRWSLFKKSEPAPSPPPPPATRQEEGASMTVRADEITFRRENDLGIWESQTGWGVVIRVRIHQP